MTNHPGPLKYMGTQSHETMAMEAALAHRAARSTEQAADIVADRTAIGGADGPSTRRRTNFARPPGTSASGWRRPWRRV